MEKIKKKYITATATLLFFGTGGILIGVIGLSFNNPGLLAYLGIEITREHLGEVPTWFNCLQFLFGAASFLAGIAMIRAKKWGFRIGQFSLGGLFVAYGFGAPLWALVHVGSEVNSLKFDTSFLGIALLCIATMSLIAFLWIRNMQRIIKWFEVKHSQKERKGTF